MYLHLVARFDLCVTRRLYKSRRAPDLLSCFAQYDAAPLEDLWLCKVSAYDLKAVSIIFEAAPSIRPP